MNTKLNLCIIILLAIFGCKEAGDFYLGIPLQPRFDGDTFQPGLNVFGIIRPDSILSYNKSFVEVQKAVPAVGSDDSIYTDTALVFIERIQQSVEDIICDFILEDDSNIFNENQYHATYNFNPRAGEIFRLECSYEDLPVLTAFTIVPKKPALSSNSVEIYQQQLNFELLPDSSIFMYDLYVYSNGEITGYTRIPASLGINTKVEMMLKSNEADSIEAFAYDYNLANYYLTSNVSLNFNKYRETFSEVENGYGVFGSLNRCVFNINEKK